MPYAGFYPTLHRAKNVWALSRLRKEEQPGPLLLQTEW